MLRLRLSSLILLCSLTWSDGAQIVIISTGNTKNHDNPETHLSRFPAPDILHFKQTTGNDHAEKPLFSEVQPRLGTDSDESMAERLEPRGNMFRFLSCWFKEKLRRHKSRRTDTYPRGPLIPIMDRRDKASRQGTRGKMVVPAAMDTSPRGSPLH
ncbi:unnamed protein product [Bemisia tabaci]|uniref:Uncharacterized protein n=1 Tax=Bemisia tabaci TaxID=7038 RepID=A0A9P0F250_BEMTA|nr:unnamed protein product [Bemisia tabaci]